MLDGGEQRFDAPPLGVAGDDRDRRQVGVGADQQALLGRLIAAVGLLQLHPHGADHPPFQEARSDATGSVAHDVQIAVWDLGGAVDRQRLDFLTHHPRAVLAGPSATPRPRRLWNLIEREVPEREVPEREVPEREVPEREVPEREVPEREVPEREVPEREVPEREVPEREVPEREVPEREVPEREVPE